MRYTEAVRRNRDRAPARDLVGESGMSSFAELSLKDRLFMEGYPYLRSPWRKMSPLRKPLAEARGTLVTTAALHLPQQAPFDIHLRGGDWSYREIPGSVEVSRLRSSHRSRSFDPS